MKILLLGANGQLGTELCCALEAVGDVVCATRSGKLASGVSCEVADFDLPHSLPELVERIAPEVVVNAAAYTAVDKAEDDVDAAFRANADSPAQLASCCREIGATLVHYSTDYVFDGSSHHPYREQDLTSPLGVYGASKLAGEEAIRASGCRHLIFRTAWVYASHSKNFLRTILRLAGERDELRIVGDQFGTPTSASLIADITARILAQRPQSVGMWHLTASGETSWHGFAEAIVDGALRRGLLVKAPQVVAIASAEYPTRARRPSYSRLDTSSLTRDFGIALPDWRDGLWRVLDEISAG